ncbi:MAG: SigE family RNA polymerase sigma factor [Nocardioides sp.]
MSRQPVESEFTDFVHTWWASLYRTSYLLVGDHGLAEDLLQTSLTKTYLAWPRLRDPAAAPAYTKKAILSTAASWFRKRSWRNEVPQDHLPETLVRRSSSRGDTAGIWSAAGDGDGPRPHSEEIDDHLAIVEALRCLSPRQRAVIVLRYYEEMSVDETATTLGCTTGTIKRHCFDGLARLRGLLDDPKIPDAAIPAHHLAIATTQGEVR